jgi:hypothetical protein
MNEEEKAYYRELTRRYENYTPPPAQGVGEFVREMLPDVNLLAGRRRAPAPMATAPSEAELMRAESQRRQQEAVDRGQYEPPMALERPEGTVPEVLERPADQAVLGVPGGLMRTPTQEEFFPSPLDERSPYFGGGRSASVSVRAPVARAARVRTDNSLYDAAMREADKQFERAQAFESERRKEQEVKLKEAEARLKEADDLRGKFKFDPNRAMPTLGSKIAAGIAIALGEAARGFRGGQGPNVGLDLINQSIDREIERQKLEYSQLGDNVDAARNLYKRNLDILNNEIDAENKTREQMLGLAAQKGGILLEKARQTDLNNRLQAQLNQQMATLSMKVSQSQKGAAVKPASQDFILARTQDLANANKLVSDVKQAKAALRSIGDERLNEIFAQLDEGTGFLGGGPALSTQIALALQESVGAPREEVPSIVQNVTNVLFSQIGEIQGAAEFNSIIRMLAFGMAKEGQSSSSISNRDVQMFVDILANRARKPEMLYAYMNHLKDLAEINAVMHNYMVTKDPRTKLSPLERGENYTHAIDFARRRGFSYDPATGGWETAFIKELQQQGKTDEQIASGALGSYAGRGV